MDFYYLRSNARLGRFGLSDRGRGRNMWTMEAGAAKDQLYAFLFFRKKKISFDLLKTKQHP